MKPGITGMWQVSETCPYLCEQGACTGECLPGSSQCDGLDVQTQNGGVSKSIPASQTIMTTDGSSRMTIS